LVNSPGGTLANSPTQRSLALLRKDGWTCTVTEKYNPFAQTRQDLFGFIDIVCLRGGEGGILGVQTTTGSNLSARLKKIKAIPEYKLWLESGGRIEIHGWGKKGKVGKRKLWEVKIVTVSV
jgi:hypothetical protein